jgi:hypothetical protein
MRIGSMVFRVLSCRTNMQHASKYKEDMELGFRRDDPGSDRAGDLCVRGLENGSA